MIQNRAPDEQLKVPPRSAERRRGSSARPVSAALIETLINQALVAGPNHTANEEGIVGASQPVGVDQVALPLQGGHQLPPWHLGVVLLVTVAAVARRRQCDTPAITTPLGEPVPQLRLRRGVQAAVMTDLVDVDIG